MRKIITTVGTSLFNNYKAKAVCHHYGNDYQSIDEALSSIEKENPIASEIYADSYKHYIRSIQEKIIDFWFEYKNKPNEEASAEIKSILKIAAERPGMEVEVHLLATDTLLSVLAAEMIRDWFAQYQKSGNIKTLLFQRIQPKFDRQEDSDYVIKNLRMSNQTGYEEGFLNLISVLNKVCKKEKKEEDEKEEDEKEEEKEFILNITGGYKAIVPVMTLYGQLKKIELRYIYDESDLGAPAPLLQLGNLPINFDWSVGELYADYLEKDVLDTLPNDNPILEVLSKYKLIDNANRKLTVLGTLLNSYIDQKMLEGKSSFGYFAEYKVFEAFIIKPYKDYGVPNRGVEYWWDQVEKDKHDLKSNHNNNSDKEKRIEIDIVLTKSDGAQVWVEVKPYSKTGLRKIPKQFQDKLDFNQAALHATVEEMILILYKFNFETINQNQQITNIDRLVKERGIPCFTVLYFDIPVSLKGEKLDHKAFFEKPIELKSL